MNEISINRETTNIKKTLPLTLQILKEGHTIGGNSTLDGFTNKLTTVNSTPSSKICIGIMTCNNSKNRFDKFMELFENDFKKYGIKYYILIADPKLMKKKIEYKITGNYFFVGMQDKYETLAHKLAIFYTYLYEHTNYEYIYKVDDGCFIDIVAILNFPKGENYVGSLMVPTSNKIHRGKCTTENFNVTDLDFRHNFQLNSKINKNILDGITNMKYAGGGYGYGMTRKALSNIPQYKKHILSVKLSYEDVLYGQIMYLSGINPFFYRIGKYHGIKPNKK